MTNLQTHLIRCELTAIDQGWDARDVCSSFWRLYINNRDGARIRCPHGPYPLPPGQIHLIPAYVRFSCHNTASIDHLYMHFDVLGLTPLLQKRLFPRPMSLPLSPPAPDLFERHMAGDNIDRSPALLCLTQSLVWSCLSQVIAALSHADQSLLQSAFEEANPIRPALDLIEQRLPRATSVNQMAGACGLKSEDHFIRAFRDTVGQTPGKYVLEKRITLAARQLLFGAGSIESIAEKHGFANRFHFTRAFARVMGTTPAAYRRSSRV